MANECELKSGSNIELGIKRRLSAADREFTFIFLALGTRISRKAISRARQTNHYAMFT